MESYLLQKYTAAYLLVIIFISLPEFSHITQAANAPVLFSSLPSTLILTAPNQGQVLNAGEDKIGLSWRLNPNLNEGTDDSSYNEVKVKLCFAPISQIDRGWRRTLDDLTEDKTCQFTIFDGFYQRNYSFEWKIDKHVPTAVYFLRAYAIDSQGKEVAYGQTTETDRFFEIRAITGRHLSLDIASVCFSVFSVLSLIAFFAVEKYRNKNI